MYPRNAASPERIPIGAVVQISDGAVQTSGVSVKVMPQGGAAAAAEGTIGYEEGIVHYVPTQAETNYTSFMLIAYKAGCIPASVGIVTTAESTAGKVSLGTNQSGVTIGTVNTLTGHTPQTGDSYAVVNHADYGNAKLVRSTTPGNALAVDASGKVAVPDTQKVDLNTIKTQTVTAGAAVTVGAYVGQATAALAVDASGHVTLANGAHGGAGASLTLSDYSDFHATGFSTHSAADVWSVEARTLTAFGFTAAANVTQIEGHALAGTGTRIADGFEHFFNVETPAKTMNDVGVAGSGLSAEDVWTYGTRVLTAGTNLNFSTHSAADVVSAIGTGTTLTAIPWNASWDAEVQSEVQDALEANNLDHLLKIPTGSTDMTNECADYTILSRVIAGGDTSTFSPGTHNLVALRNRGDVAWITATGFLDAAGVRNAIGLASANLDTQLSGILGYVDCLPASWVTVPTTGEIKTALEADGSKLDHLWETTEDDGGVRRFTENALEMAPGGGGGGDATADNQTTIITHLTDIKGTGFVKDTNSLVNVASGEAVNIHTEGTNISSS